MPFLLPIDRYSGSTVNSVSWNRSSPVLSTIGPTSYAPTETSSPSPFAVSCSFSVFPWWPTLVSKLPSYFDERIIKGTIVSGWRLHIPINGFLLGQRNVHPLGMFFPNYSDILDIRREKILRLHTSDDGYTIELLLVYLLGRVCTSDHGCEYRIS